MPDQSAAPNPTGIDTSPNRVPKQPSMWKHFIPVAGPLIYFNEALERKKKATDLIDARNGLLTKLPTLLSPNGEETDDHKKARQALDQTNYDLGQMYHPDNHPTALREDYHWLLDKMHGIKPASTTSQTPAVTLNAPAAPLVTPELPADAGQAAVPSTTNPGMAGSVSIPAGPQTTVAKAAPIPWKQGQAQKIKDEAIKRAQGDTNLQIASAPLSPNQQAVVTANAANAGSLADIQGKIKNYKLINPTATPEDVSAYTSTLLPGNNQVGNWERVDGTIDGQPYAISYDKKRGVYKYPDGSISSNMPENFKPSPKATGATAEELREYAADTDPNKGPFPQWMANKRAQGTASAPKSDRDDRYIAIIQKKSLGQPLTNDEQAYLTAFDLWDQKTKIDPGVARAAAFGAMRYIPVVSPTDPDNVVMMRAGDAARAGVNTPASIGFKTDAAMTKYMTSGQGGTNINYFNTASDHLKLLAQAGDALNNGDTQAFNALANRFATATGDPAPSNFETVKAAVAGELSKTFKGTGATDSEIADINQTINQAQSPQQIQGAISYYTRLMESKIQALQGQWEAGKQGKPNFPGSASSNTSQSKGLVSVAAAMKKQKYKGKSYAEVSDAITKAGYTPIP